MEKDIIIYIIVGLVLSIVLGATIFVRKNYPRPTDYRAVFYIGLAWMAIGFTNDNNYLMALAGLIFMIAGFVNRSKWKENRFRWSKLSLTEKKIKITVLSTIVFGVFAGLMVHYSW